MTTESTATGRKRSLITGNGGVDELYPVPQEDLFEGDFLPAPDVEKIARALINAHEHEFLAVHQFEVTYLWKKKGGEKSGKATLGKCAKPSGLTRYFSEADFVIWLAADHLGHRSRFDVEAVIFHELHHIGQDSETGKPVIVPHDLDIFSAEVETYGAWSNDIKLADRAFRQLPLFAEDAVAEFRSEMQAMVDDESSGITGVAITVGGKRAVVAEKK